MKEQKIQRPLIKVAAFIKDFWRLWGGICLGFAWQAWHLWHWAGSGGVLGSVLVAGDAGDATALCVAGVELGDIHLRFTWQAQHLATSTFVLRGRRGTW